MKKIVSTLSAAVMSLSIAATSTAAGISFGDVTEDDWFYDDIKTVVELGLINGKSNDRYAPNDNLTYAEAIKLAACMHQFYTEGKVTLEKGDPWYQPYVDYCIENRIIAGEYNYGENATRAGYITIFANALPDEALKEINDIPDNSIPDVPSERDCAAAVYKLYRAGILTGVDDKHNCEPFVNISRKEVAAIVARMMNEKKRTHFVTVSIDAEQSEEDNAERGNASEYVGNETTTYEALIFSQTPSDVSVDCGEEATFQTEVLSGREPFTYRWQYSEDGSWIDFEDTADEKTTVTGAEETTLTVKTSIPGVTELRCIVTDSVGKEHETPTATLTVNAISLTEDWSVVGTYTPDNGTANNDVDAGAGDNVEDKDSSVTTDPDASGSLKIEAQPSDVSVAAEQTAKFTVNVSGGTAPYSYRWQGSAEVAGKTTWQDMTNLKGVCSGAKSKVLSFTSPKAGELTLRCVISDSDGNTVTTVPVKLTITEKKAVSTLRKNPL